MIGFFGHLAIVLAFLTAAFGAVAALAGERVAGGGAWGRRSAFAVLALVAVAVGMMEVALITHDFSVKYVAEHGSRETPLYYTIISLWGALEGSILYWALLLSLYTCAFLVLHARRYAHFEGSITAILLAISAFFLFVIAWPGDPFAPVSPPVDGAGPNPLLQNHWMMGVHPQLLYLGYVGLSVPFAIAMASLIHGEPSPGVMRLIRRWALVPFVFLSLGIVAGMWWSYAVLGWGGYWSWDPVENASVMPWLVTTAFLHSLQVQERRQMLKAWTMSLIIVAFLLSILGTFLTRSGVLASVHSFTQSSIGPLFLGFFGVVLVSSLGLLFSRSGKLAAPGSLESTVCRETAFLVNNLLLVAMTFTVLLGTMFPLIAEALQGSQLTVGAPYFNNVAVPLAVALVFLMGVGPALPWGATRFDQLQYRLLLPVAVGVASVFILLLLGLRGIGTLITFGLAGFALTVTLGRVRADVGARRSARREGWSHAAGRVFRANPRRYGGYLAHLGVLLAVVGIAASQSYGVRALATLRPGQAMSVDGYRLVYRGWQPRPEANRMVIQARVDVSRSGRSLGTLTPSQNIYAQVSQPVVTPAVREEPGGMLADLARGVNPLADLASLFQGRNPFEDVYVVLDAVTSSTTGPGTLLVLVNPMVGFIWLGGLLLGLGGALALVPGRRRRSIPAAAREPVALQPEEAVV